VASPVAGAELIHVCAGLVGRVQAGLDVAGTAVQVLVERRAELLHVRARLVRGVEGGTDRVEAGITLLG
jgi:hypothetical protein